MLEGTSRTIAWLSMARLRHNTKTQSKCKSVGLPVQPAPVAPVGPVEPFAPASGNIMIHSVTETILSNHVWYTCELVDLLL